MSILGQSDEHDQTAKREPCTCCAKIVIPHDYLDNGPICRKCTNEATEIRLTLVIRGRTMSKTLKGNLTAIKGGRK